MLEKLFEDIDANPQALKITGKHLLYRIDLEGLAEKIDDQFRFRIEGDIRFGVFKSRGCFESYYRDQEQPPLLVSHGIEFPGIRFTESYREDHRGMIFSKNNSVKKTVESEAHPFLEPLPFVFKLLGLKPEGDVNFVGKILLNGQMKPLHFEKSSKLFQVSLNSKLLFKGEIVGDGQTLIRIPRFKVELSLTRI